MGSIREAPWNKRRVSKFSLGIFRSTGEKVLRGDDSLPHVLPCTSSIAQSTHSLWIEFEFGGDGGVCWRLFADDLAVALVAMALEAAGRASSQWHIAAWTPSAPPSISE